METVAVVEEVEVEVPCPLESGEPWPRPQVHDALAETPD